MCHQASRAPHGWGAAAAKRQRDDPTAFLAQRDLFGDLIDNDRFVATYFSAYRGLYFTGDGARRDADGYWWFVDRLKDCIRRSGENISSFEVEAEVRAHPAVLECAAVAQPDQRRGEEVRVLVVTRPGHGLAPADLLAFLADRLPAFALPRYVELVEELPKTPLGKIRKAELRAGAMGAGVWDREQQ